MAKGKGNNTVPFSCDVLNIGSTLFTPAQNTAPQNKDAFFTSLPASYRTKEDNLEIPTSTTSDPENFFLWQDLDVKRLNVIHDWLWLAGRPMPARPLHRQKLLGREILIAEQVDMHLTWSKSHIFVKPIPRYLLQPGFWKDRLVCEPKCSCSNPPEKHTKCELWARAFGFLLSYAALIAYESDYHIAITLHLLPQEVTWQQWKTLVQDLLSYDTDTKIYNHINKRFLYGELRLGRLNLIYRLTNHAPIRGYASTHDAYSSFFRDNFGWLATLTVYIAVVLTAMQVGLGTDQLRENKKFNAASYGFTVFSIVAPLVVLFVVVVLFGGLVGYNWVATVRYKRERFGRMGIKGNGVREKLGV